MHTVLDIGCGFGSFGAHLLSLKVMPVCIAAYEATGSQVQLALERGLPAIIGNFIASQLPYPSLSFDMVHCAQCGILWDQKGKCFGNIGRHDFGLLLNKCLQNWVEAFAQLILNCILVFMTMLFQITLYNGYDLWIIFMKSNIL